MVCSSWVRFGFAIGGLVWVTEVALRGKLPGIAFDLSGCGDRTRATNRAGGRAEGRVADRSGSCPEVCPAGREANCVLSCGGVD